ncbi:MAG: hypothetical protein AAF127_12535 [Pseudomonadota bacterium]
MGEFSRRDVVSDEELASAAFKACVLASGVVGMEVGAVLGVKGILVGGGAGLMWGMAVCGAAEKKVYQRLQNGKSAMTQQDFTMLKRSVMEVEPNLSAREALVVIEKSATKMFQNIKAKA